MSWTLRGGGRAGPGAGGACCRWAHRRRRWVEAAATSSAADCCCGWRPPDVSSRHRALTAVAGIAATAAAVGAPVPEAVNRVLGLLGGQ
ncbi:hypothetical protein C3488_05450 [Streptomyces sp. Ru72]|nr:hypothetical protein C3488_05450 [Streptomyces sp. Ru72]